MNESSGRFNGNTMISAGVVMYGGSPYIPADPHPWIPNPMPVEPVPFLPPQVNPLISIPALTPCKACRRHVVTGTDCPFCFAVALVKNLAKPANAPTISVNENVRRTFPTGYQP